MKRVFEHLGDRNHGGHIADIYSKLDTAVKLETLKEVSTELPTWRMDKK